MTNRKSIIPRLFASMLLMPWMLICGIVMFNALGRERGALGQERGAKERRAKPPKYDSSDFRGVFYEDLGRALGGQRPRIAELNSGANDGKTDSGTTEKVGRMLVQSAGESTNGESTNGGATNASQWNSLADPGELVDEIKRVKLEFDGLMSTPGRFKSGNYRDARSKMFVLATLMAVVAEYEGDVRFKKDAAVVRDLLAGSATGLSGDSFTEARQRQFDLQELVSGGGLNRTAPEREVDWTEIGSRIALMQYLENLMTDTLRNGANDAGAVESNAAELKRAAAMVAVVGEAIQQTGMDEADDPDYTAFAEAMKAAAIDLRKAIAQKDATAARLSVGAIGQSCSNCHEQYN